MSFTPEQSAVRVDKSLEEEIANAPDAESIKLIMKRRLLEDHKVVPDFYDSSILLPVEPSPAAPAPQKFTQVVVVDKKKIFLESDSYDGLQQKVEQTYQALLAQPATQQQPSPLRDEHGRFTDAEQVELARRTESELRFRRGEITAAQYLEESNAVAEYLQKQGVDMNALRQTSGAAFEQSWADAAAQFAEVHPDWPGSEVNKNLLGRVIEANGWMEVEDKAAALHAAYEQLKAQDALVMTPEQELSEKLANAKSHSDVADALQSLRPAGSSGFFGGR